MFLKCISQNVGLFLKTFYMYSIFFQFCITSKRHSSFFPMHQPGITNKILGLYLGRKSQSEMNFVGKDIAVLYSGQGQEMRLSHIRYSITKSHHPPLQASPKTMPVSHWHFLKLKKLLADRWSLSIPIWWGQTEPYVYYAVHESSICMYIFNATWAQTPV